MDTKVEFREANASFVTERLLVGGDLDLYDDAKAVRQLVELVVDGGVTHVIDCRLEADDTDFYAELSDVTYLHHGMDDAGQRVPAEWFDVAVTFALDALNQPGTKVLTHCHMGINRGPSLGYAVLLALGWEPVEAIAAIRAARPIANVWYAEDALRWHHDRKGADPVRRCNDVERLRTWRRDNPLDVVRIIAGVRAGE
jgi:hypothetical protein